MYSLFLTIYLIAMMTDEKILSAKNADDFVPKTMYQKIWDAHVIDIGNGSNNSDALIYIDLQLIHEVTSAQAFEGLRLERRGLRRPDRTFAVMDHNVPTSHRSQPITDPIAAQQLETLQRNCNDFGVTLFDMNNPKQGIVHVVGPELGLTQPGMTIVCGDSHTATHGAFGALAFGIGTSEVEHVFATQTLRQKKSKTFRINGTNILPSNCSSKDLILYIIGELSTSAAAGYIVEYTGTAFTALSMEGRMTVCNMTIEMGGRSGMIAPDDKTFAYLVGREYAPNNNNWEQALTKWKELATDQDAVFDKEWEFNAAKITPMVTWGTNPAQVTSIDGRIPLLDSFTDLAQRKSAEAALKYMDLREGMRITDIPINRVFIGSCTNGRIEDLRIAAAVVKGRRIAGGVYGMVVPGSGQVKREAEREGLDKIFITAGFDWREPGCSMCLGMNPDQLNPGDRCAATSNRNFEGRQGKGGRTHLVSPATAAAAGIAGHFVEFL
ncbi:MAG: 3-isopropylmalate dehydratase large subunit [Planctomycetaceae bacterium]|jgi:3-isopropylmalate/(R)-2-methylmalate dehydratase large subunit|nr:3-isopropylmalate dehydratase large subunit [Planctomycetaceae bacterium]